MILTTRIYGVVLIVLGVASYVLTGRASLTALIPALFGALLIICALIARNEAARKHAMHVAVAIGLLGAVAALFRAIPGFINGNLFRPAVLAQVVMAIVLFAYVVHGVLSFIAARKARALK
jgi:hypothetical protein